MTTPQPPSRPFQVPHFWTEPLGKLLQELKSGSKGLSSIEAASRLRILGPNIARPHRKRALALEFFSRFGNPLVILLLVASAVSALTGDTTGFVTISVMVLVSVVLDFVQEFRAGRAAERLQQSVALNAKVFRDAKIVDVAVSHLVPGDVVVLAAGDIVPADACLLEARDCFVNQALLTGEPFPVEKCVSEQGNASKEMTEASNALFMGTSVVSGSATILLCRTGIETLFGEISSEISRKPPATAFERGTRQVGLMIMRLTLLLVFFALLANTLAHRPVLESFLFAVALAVGLTPELLPMVVSVTLAAGAMQMAKKRVIVKRLSSIQDLGAMDVLCTDKTGTLTEAKIRLERHVDASGQESDRVLELAYLNSYFETGIRSPLDEAILQHENIDMSAWHKIDEIPFDFERRRVSVLVERGDTRLLVVKGAPEDILKVCTHCEGKEADSRDLTPENREEIDKLFKSLSQEGFRLLGIAWQKVPSDHVHAKLADESQLVFAGFASFLDPPKASAAQALRQLEGSNVQVKILTGDNEWVTQHLCAQLGTEVKGVLTGGEVQQMDDAALGVRVGQVNLFCRMNPGQKTRILLALKSRGHVVGYLGDGVNDAPSMHSADVGISVDSAVDVAKEAADMILLEHDLGIFYEGIREGRKTFSNVMKYIMMATSSNFGNMFSMAAAAILLPFLPMLPVQILLNNLLYDLSELTIPLDAVDEGEVATPRHWEVGFIQKFMICVGPVSSVFDFLTFFVMLKVFSAGEALFHTGWFVESIATQVLVIFIIRTRGNPLRSRPSPWLIVSSLSVVAFAMVLPFLPFATYLGFVPLPGKFFLFLFAMVLSYLLAVEFVKLWFYHGIGKKGAKA